MEDAGFISPNWDEPLDVKERLAGLPEGRTIKGMVLQSIVEAAVEGSGHSPEDRGPYNGFLSYPLSELIEMLAECGPLAFPGKTQREAVRLLGRRAFFAVRNSMPGKVVFSLGGRDFESVVKMVAKIYSIATEGSVKVLEMKEGQAIIQLTGMWVYPDCYHVGLYEGAMELYDIQGELKVRRHSICDVDIMAIWR